jgi:hypothetical protein
MLVEEFVRLTNARRTGRGKWMAFCPVHGDKNRSMAVAEGKRGILVKCMSMGCDTRDILDVLGLKYRDLFYTSRTLPSAQLKAIYAQRRIDELYEREIRRQTLKMWIQSLECRQKPVRTKTRFECDIELFCDRILRV